MFENIRRCFAAAPHRPLRPEAEVRRLYPRFRWQMLEATFIGYSAFYIVRNNLAVVAKDIEGSLGYSHSMIGSILAITAISYGLGKFVMGAVSDRCNPRVFMASGLGLTALCNFIFGSVGNYPVHLALWALNGFFQGMGWPPCGRVMGHWYSKRERGLMFSLWNSSTNVGGGLAGVVAGWAAFYFGSWRAAFYFPGALAAVGAVYLFVRLRDTPQSVGLPPIEEYHGERRYGSGILCPKCDYNLTGNTSGVCPECGAPVIPDTLPTEHELSFRELLVNHVLLNKYVWLIAIANLFAYISRYSMLDWGPTYLREMKGASLQGGGYAVFVTEFGGIPSVILLGWLSDKIGGRRGLVAALGMLPVLAAFTGILLTPAGYLWLDMVLLSTVGLFVYPVINFVQIMTLDISGKKAIGTAAGFVGLLGYLGRTIQAKGFGWMLDHFGHLHGPEVAWRIVIATILVCSAIACLLLAFSWLVTARAQRAASEQSQMLTEATKTS